MQLSVKVLIGLGLGVLAGLVFGEKIAFLKIVGDIFVLSLQMTVLPYIMISLINGFGGLSAKNALMLAKHCGWVLLLLWAIGLLMVLVMALAFPNWQMASFFSTSLVEPQSNFNYLNFYIPSNIFFSLSNNIIPAVVVFSLATGIALIGVRNKDTLLKTLSTMQEALSRVTNFLVRLAPYGVFAIIASYLGVLRLEELQRLQVYMINYMVISVLLSFWILPSLVTSLTPFSYKQLVGPVRTALITAFATGNIFVVLPLLTESCKNLLKTQPKVNEESGTSVDIIIPASFSFPNMGKILSLSFVLFAGWLANAIIPASKYLSFIFTGFFSFFGDPTVAIPSLLNMYRIPSDTFRFFLVADNLVGTRFGTLLAAMYTLVLAVLGASAVGGILKIKLRKLILNSVVSLILLVVSVTGLRYFYERVVSHEYKDDQALVSMKMIRQYPQAKSIDNNQEITYLKNSPGLNRCDAIKERGFIRVGYFSGALPFAFKNQENELVGFDIEMANILAKEMNLKLELVQIDRSDLADMLDSGKIDIAMSGIAVTLERLSAFQLSASYLNQTFAFIVKDHRLKDFNTRDKIQQLKKLKIATMNSPYYIDKIKYYLPQADIVVVKSPEEFFISNNNNDVDAFAYTAEAGSAWSLIYPEYTVAIPYPDLLELPLAYALPKSDIEFKNYIDTWIELKKKDKTISNLYDQWILGKSKVARKPRWSVIRDVLHWID